MSKCQECRQDIPKVFKAGDMVESFAFGKHRVGVIPTRETNAAFQLATSTLVGEVGFVDIRTGQYCHHPSRVVEVVHGYIHLDRWEL